MNKTDPTKKTGVEPSYLWNTSKNTDSAYLSHILLAGMKRDIVLLCY
jgi:hypothetical protein